MLELRRSDFVSCHYFLLLIYHTFHDLFTIEFNHILFYCKKKHHYVHNMTLTYIQIFITKGLDHKLLQHQLQSSPKLVQT